jgi:hypothetical protein
VELMGWEIKICNSCDEPLMITEKKTEEIVYQPDRDEEQYEWSHGSRKTEYYWTCNNPNCDRPDEFIPPDKVKWIHINKLITQR